MSSGAYVLVGIVLGGVVSIGTQVVLAAVVERRRDKREWLVATRLVSEELFRLMLDLKALIEQGMTPPIPGDARWLATSAWEEHRLVFARLVPSDAKGDRFWRALASIFSTAAQLRMGLLSLAPGTQLNPLVLKTLGDGFVSSWHAFSALNEEPPELEPPPGLDITARADGGDSLSRDD